MRRMVKIELALIAVLSAVCAMVAPPGIVWFYMGFSAFLITTAILQ